MRSLVYLTILLVMMIQFSACAPNLFMEGQYQTDPKSGITMAGNTFHFYEGNRFELNHFSDDISSNKMGKGTYAIDGDQLKLTFENSIPEQNIFEQKVIDPGNRNMIKYLFYLKDHNDKALLGVTITLHGDDGEVVIGGVTNEKGICSLKINKKMNPKKLAISYLGMEDFKMSLMDDASKAFNIKLARKTSYYQAGEKLEYTFKNQKAALLLKRSGTVQRLVKN